MGIITFTTNTCSGILQSASSVKGYLADRAQIPSESTRPLLLYVFLSSNTLFHPLSKFMLSCALSKGHWIHRWKYGHGHILLWGGGSITKFPSMARRAQK